MIRALTDRAASGVVRMRVIITTCWPTMTVAIPVLTTTTFPIRRGLFLFSIMWFTTGRETPVMVVRVPRITVMSIGSITSSTITINPVPLLLQIIFGLFNPLLPAAIVAVPSCLVIFTWMATSWRGRVQLTQITGRLVQKLQLAYITMLPLFLKLKRLHRLPEIMSKVSIVQATHLTVSWLMLVPVMPVTELMHE